MILIKHKKYLILFICIFYQIIAVCQDQSTIRLDLLDSISLVIDRDTTRRKSKKYRYSTFYDTELKRGGYRHAMAPVNPNKCYYEYKISKRFSYNTLSTRDTIYYKRTGGFYAEFMYTERCKVIRVRSRNQKKRALLYE